MIGMPDKVFLGIPLLTIIASLMLSFDLLLELVSGEGIASIVVCHASFVANGFSNRLSTFATSIRFFNSLSMLRATVFSAVYSFFLYMFVVVSYGVCSVLFPMSLIVLGIVSLSFFLVCLFPLSVVYFPLFFMILKPLLIFCTAACLAFVSVLRPPLVSALVEESQGIILPTNTALFALGAVERYTVIHDKVYSLSSRLRMFAASLSHHIYTPFYRKTASKATSHLFYSVRKFLEV